MATLYAALQQGRQSLEKESEADVATADAADAADAAAEQHEADEVAKATGSKWLGGNAKFERRRDAGSFNFTLELPEGAAVRAAGVPAFAPPGAPPARWKGWRTGDYGPDPDNRAPGEEESAAAGGGGGGGGGLPPLDNTVTHSLINSVDRVSAF